MSGAGNIFSVIDNREYNLDFQFLKEHASAFCNYMNLKTEGLIVVNPSGENLDMLVDFFNPDGSFGAMCGNGGRCAAFFGREKEFFFNKSFIKFRMAGSEYSAQFNEDTVSLFLPPPLEIKFDLSLEFENQKFNFGYYNVGSDHFVSNINVYTQQFDDFYKIDLNDISRKIRFHNSFAPRGVNVNFYFIGKDDSVYYRTYERGVEAETGACGTGAISTALHTILKENLKFPVKLIPPSRIPLIVDSEIDETGQISKIILTGEAKIINETEVII